MLPAPLTLVALNNALTSATVGPVYVKVPVAMLYVKFPKLSAVVDADKSWRIWSDVIAVYVNAPVVAL